MRSVFKIVESGLKSGFSEFFLICCLLLNKCFKIDTPNVDAHILRLSVNPVFCFARQYNSRNKVPVSVVLEYGLPSLIVARCKVSVALGVLLSPSKGMRKFH